MSNIKDRIGDADVIFEGNNYTLIVSFDNNREVTLVVSEQHVIDMCGVNNLVFNVFPKETILTIAVEKQSVLTGKTFLHYTYDLQLETFVESGERVKIHYVLSNGHNLEVNCYVTKTVDLIPEYREVRMRNLLGGYTIKVNDVINIEKFVDYKGRTLSLI